MKNLNIFIYLNFIHFFILILLYILKYKKIFFDLFIIKR